MKSFLSMEVLTFIIVISQFIEYQWPLLERVLYEIVESLSKIKRNPCKKNRSKFNTENSNNKRIEFNTPIDMIDEKNNKTIDPFRFFVLPILKKNGCQIRKAVLLRAYEILVSEEKIVPCEFLRNILVTSESKSFSGVLVITVLTAPYPTVNGIKQTFSCKWDCYYCPNQPGQPRSYLRDEPAVLRANQNGFDPILQFYDRARVLQQNGHPLDKIELLILGGTWSSYQHEYQESFIRDLFYAANTVNSPGKYRRARDTIENEKRRNESAQCKIIGITLETRPDCISVDELLRFRRYGCTRVQLGVQHVDNDVLRKINRKCTIEDTKYALQLLKDCCFKVDIHLMPNLPGSNLKKDQNMFDEVLSNPDLQADQWKIYPCEIVPWTVIQKWYESGDYVPYSDADLTELIIETKVKVHPWIRLNRIIRDIPTNYIIGGIQKPNMRQYIQHEMKKRQLLCRCIRCREIGSRKTPQKIEIVYRKYSAQNGTEYFISFESSCHSVILGFVRLRINSNSFLNTEDYSFLQSFLMRFINFISLNQIVSLPQKYTTKFNFIDTQKKKMSEQYTFPELQGTSLVRELHVYGKLIITNDKTRSHAQHIGLGKRLMAEAEKLSLELGIKKIAVISGVGVRNFYRRLGYKLEGNGEMMIKKLDQKPLFHGIFNANIFCIMHFIIISFLLIFFIIIMVLQQPIYLFFNYLQFQ